MSDFEREMVNCLNRFFKTNRIEGFAYRTRQHTVPGRWTDVLVDSPHPSYFLLITCKSIIDKKLYFSQHFHAAEDSVHRVDKIADFLKMSGRRGFLALEFRQGPGTENEAFLIPWPVVAAHFREHSGIAREDARSGIVLVRSKDGYLLNSLNAK
jgi:hypothetical protein